MEKERKNIGSKKLSKGITLVALVITIVVLIILSVISINIIFGEEGIVESTKQAKQATANAQAAEEEILADTANSVDKYIAGERETVTIDKEEYDRLKNANIYSVDEIEIGKWTDGKTIYRKTYFIESATTGINVTTIDLSSVLPNVDTMVRIEGIYHRSDGWEIPLNAYQESTKYRYLTFNKTTKKLAYYGMDSNGGSISVFFEYTKTTDTSNNN